MRLSSLVRSGLLVASRSSTLRALAVKQRVRLGAARFVAGTTLDDFAREAGRQNRLQRRVAAGYLGEGVRDRAAARRIARDFSGILERISGDQLDSTVAVKLSHLGLDVDFAEAERNVGDVVRTARRLGNFVRIDMEESRRVDATLRLYRLLRAAGEDAVGVVLQACLRRSSDDLNALAALAPNIRLVKGAYLEPAEVAFQDRREIDRAYVGLIESALRSLPFIAIATHDDEIIEETIVLVRRYNVPTERFEFQMLLGVREPLAENLVARGFNVRISVPFGADWYPYLMRRMAENPQNLGLILRNWTTRQPGGRRSPNRGITELPFVRYPQTGSARGVQPCDFP